MIVLRLMAAFPFVLSLMMYQPDSARAALMMSQLGGVCMDAEGGVREGARLLGYPCHGAANQNFEFVNSPNTRLRAVGTNFCASSDSRSQGSEIRLRACDFSNHGNALQNFAPWQGYLIGHNTGYVMDLSGGWGGQLLTAFSGMRQPVVLWGKHGGENQRWAFGYMKRYSSWSQVSDGSYFAIRGLKGLFLKRGNSVVDANSGNLIGVDAGTLIGVDAGTLIAAGGLN